MIRLFLVPVVRLLAKVALLALAVVLVVSVVTGSARAQSYSVLHTFQGASQGGDGSTPYAGLVRGPGGNLYGTTYFGGGYGKGVVFKIGSGGVYSLPHTFRGGSDGAHAWAGLIRDAAGNLYGTTALGGGNGCGSNGCGVVFKVTIKNKETVLHAFIGGATDGQAPLARLVRDSSGNLYGTTYAGGTSNLGTVFRVDSTLGESVSYSFPGDPNGWGPYAGLVRDPVGNLYGTTAGGGAGFGTVFRLDTSGTETVLYPFAGGTDGSLPEADLIRDAQGNLYGTTVGGGAFGFGTIFKVDTVGNETVLHSFGGQDGEHPYAGLIQDAGGNFYGTASGGGTFGFGTVFKLAASGQLAVLYSFSGGADGANPQSPVVRDAAGNIYGTTFAGGSTGRSCKRIGGCGVVFKIAP